MGLTAASVPKSPNTDAAVAMAPALTEPVTQSDISGQSPRPGDSITSPHHNHDSSTTTVIDTATENQPNNNIITNGNNGSTPKYAAVLQISKQKQVERNKIALIEETLRAGTDDQIRSDPESRVAHMDDQRGTMPPKDDALEPAEDVVGKTDTAEVEQFLGELAASEEIDLLSVFKTLETAPVSDANFDGLGLFNEDVETVISNAYEECDPGTSREREVEDIRAEIDKTQAQLERRLDFLVRRLRKIQARSMVRNAAEQIVLLEEQAQRHTKRKEREELHQELGAQPEVPEKPRPVTGPAMKTFIRRLETTAAHQRATLTKRQLNAKYFSPALTDLLSAAPSTSKTVAQSLISVPRFDDRAVVQLDQMSGLTFSQLRMVEKSIDSDATASSSGGESADEMIPYTNQKQEHLGIAKRAAWRWACDRSQIASKWTWLLAQISDLEYRIRQHSELQVQLKKNKGSVQLEGEDPPPLPQEPQSVNGFRGVLPGGSKPVESEKNEYLETNSSSRTRPFQRATFRKRKIFHTNNLHTIAKKAARPSSMKCGCQWPQSPCALCTGRLDPTAPRDLPDTMPVPERIALLDPCYHPVLSFKEDTTQSVHFEAIMQSPDWQARAIKYTSKAAMKAAERERERGISGDERLGGRLKKSRSERERERLERRRAKSMKQLLSGDRKKYKKRLGLVSGKYRKNKKGSTNNRVKFAQLFSKNNKFNSSSSTSAKKNKSRASISGSHLDGGNHAKGGHSSTSFVNSYLQHLEQESGGSGNNSGRSKNASPVMGQTRSERSSTDNRRSRVSYDIDNIIIPYSVAAQARVEVLPYKEIPTPKWRVLEEEEEEGETPSINPSRKASQEEDHDEDISDETFQSMHERALIEERKKFASFLKYPMTSRSRANRRTDSHASSGTNTPINPTSPGVVTPNDPENVPSPAYPLTPATPVEGAVNENSSELNVTQALNQTLNALTCKRERRRTSSMKLLQQQSSTVDTRSNTPELKEVIPPFEPRIFPLPERLYEEMLAEMPRGFRNSINNLEEEILDDLEASAKKSPGSVSKKRRRRTRRSTNNNSFSYTTADETEFGMEERLDEMTEHSEDDRSSVIQKLRLLEQKYDAERLNSTLAGDNSAAETESIDEQYVPDDGEIEDEDDAWYEPPVRL